MMQISTMNFASPLFRGLVLGIVLLLVACGGEGDSEETPEATTNVAAPTVPPASDSTAEINGDDLTMVTADATEAEATAAVESTPETSTAASTPDTIAAEPTAPDTEATAEANVLESTPAAVVETPAVDSTPEGDTATTEGPAVTSTRTPTGNEWTESAGDGTGGSGAPGEQEPGELPVDATPMASPAVATLTVQGCEVPDVPTFSGETPEQVLTAEVNFRSGPGVECDPLLDAPLGEGQAVTVIGGPVTQGTDDSEWVQIEVDGQQGWITTEFVEPVTP